MHLANRMMEELVVVVVVIFYLSDMGEDCYILSQFENKGVHS